MSFFSDMLKGMPYFQWHVLVVGAILGSVFFLCSQRWSGWRRSVLAKKRGRRAAMGEEQAERLLELEGYTVLERQIPTTWTVDMDGEDWEIALRADLLVEKEGREFIAEVKTGEFAPSLGNAATRRQMLEYAIAYESPVLLLVDVERNTIHEVRFFLSDDGSEYSILERDKC